MFKISISLLIITSLLSASCSSTRKSLALGLGTGAATGAAIGAMSSKNHSQGTLIGLGIGALVGGIASYFIHGGLEERDKETRKETLFNLEKHGVFGEPEQNLKTNESPWAYREWPREHIGGRDR
ncbi:MAG: YMGG-like glycine zipper-containing protein [Bacteriovoracaceae bacterium]